MNLFDLIDPVRHDAIGDDRWRPEAPPELDGVDEVCLNFETNGLRWFQQDRPVGCSVFAKGRSWYLPFAHRGEGNLDEAVVKRWAQRELRNKRVININTRFDLHMSRVWGADLEEQGCTFADVGHYASLLNDHRYQTSLDTLIPEFLHETPMRRLDESKMQEYAAGMAAPRARYNVEAVRRLHDLMRPMLTEQNLDRVRILEEKVIPVVCEMERNGTLVNMPLLEQWLKDVAKKYVDTIMELYRATGLKINPNSGPDQAKLFNKLHIEFTEFTETGQPSFTDDVLKHIPNPEVKLLRKAKKYKSLKSKLTKYRDSVGSDGILRYALHQLRAAKDDASEGDESGTITGRFTSTEIVDGIGINIQQVLKPEKQILTYGDEFFIRELHLPAPGTKWLSVDAEQIQYRLFADMAKNPKVLKAYEEDPWLSFHKMMWGNLKRTKPDMTYKRTKDVNFAKMFAAGVNKLSLMMEFITKREFEEFKRIKARRGHPKFARTVEILNVYAREMPEVDQLLRDCSDLALSQGYVESILGRRARFPDGEKDRLHKGLNSIIQMSEADIVKTKLVELHEQRKETGYLLRFQVHDEVDGDAPDEECVRKVTGILNTQSFPDLKVPILWGPNVGDSWGACAADELAKIRAEMHL